MCLPSICFWPLYWLPLYLDGLATATALMCSAGGAHLKCRPLSSPLMRLHVSTLRLNPLAGKRKPYAMRGETLRLVKSA